MTLTDTLESRLQAVDAQLDANDHERDQLDQQIRELQTRRHQLKPARGLLELAHRQLRFEQFAAEYGTRIPELLDGNNNQTYNDYKKLGLLPGLWATGSHWTATDQRVVSLHLHRGRTGEPEACEKVLRMLLPHLTPFDNGTVRLAIFDGRGSHWLALFDALEPDVCALTPKTRNRTVDMSEANHRFDKVLDLLKHAQANLYYSDDTAMDDD